MTGLSRRLPTRFTQFSNKSRTAAVQTGPVNMKTIIWVLTFPTCFVAIKSIRSVNTSYGIETLMISLSKTITLQKLFIL